MHFNANDFFLFLRNDAIIVRTYCDNVRSRLGMIGWWSFERGDIDADDGECDIEERQNSEI